MRVREEESVDVLTSNIRGYEQHARDSIQGEAGGLRSAWHCQRLSRGLELATMLSDAVRGAGRRDTVSNFCRVAAVTDPHGGVEGCACAKQQSECQKIV